MFSLLAEKSWYLSGQMNTPCLVHGYLAEGGKKARPEVINQISIKIFKG